MNYIIGDLHIRKEEPFYLAADILLKYLTNYFLKDGDQILFLGDFFHYSRPHPKEYDLALSFLMNCVLRNIKVHILSGNGSHEYNQGFDSYAIDPLKSVCSIIKNPTLLDISDSTAIICLPWMPDKLIKDITGEQITLRQFYENWFYENRAETLKKGIQEKKNVILCHHLEDETISFPGQELYTGIDLTKYKKDFKTINIGGHIHIQNKGYLGTPYQTRYDEKEQNGQIYCIEESSYKLLPMFMQYIDVDYNISDKKLKDINKEKIILTILNAPSIQAAEEKFEGCFIRKIEVFEGERKTSSINYSSDTANLSSLFEEFSTIKILDKETKQYVGSLIKEI